jgi:hypothetical protein
MRVKAAITVGLPQADVERLWREVSGDEEVLGYLGSVDPSAIRFTPAPRDRGTEIHVDLGSETSGGPLGEKVAKLFGTRPDQQADDDLRRFKQVAETGEVVRSEGSLRGADPKEHRTQRPAQPVGSGS